MSRRARVAWGLGLLGLLGCCCIGAFDPPLSSLDEAFTPIAGQHLPAPATHRQVDEEVDPVGLDGPKRVECELWRPFDPMTSIRLEEVDPDTLEAGMVHELHTDDVFVDFLPDHSVGLGRLYITNHEPKVISWALGACLDLVELEPMPTVTLAGRVTGVLETGAVSVSIECGEDRFYRAPQPPGGRFSVDVPASAETCVLSLRRVFGGRDLESEPITVRAIGNDQLELALPSPPGVGLGLYEISDGLRVAGVEPGTPAARSGLQLMDLVISVDGEPASDLVAEELIFETGPLRLEVVRDGKTFEVVVEAVEAND